MRDKCLIIIPSFNESQNLSKVLVGLAPVQSFADLVVIDDGSLDATAQIARNHRVPVIVHPINLGYGAALQTGFQYALLQNYQYVIQFDGDGQHNPDDLHSIWEALQNRTGDIIIGSRFLGLATTDTGELKYLVIRFLSRLIRCSTGMVVTDPTSGLRGISRRALEYYTVPGNFPSDFPDANLLIQTALSHLTIREVPVHSRPREFGVSMHRGLRPLIYVLQSLLAVLATLINHCFMREGAAS